jgi:hypothetical protein
MESTLVLTMLAQRFNPHLVPEHPAVPDPTYTLRPRNGLRMTLQGRAMGHEMLAAQQA